MLLERVRRDADNRRRREAFHTLLPIILMDDLAPSKTACPDDLNLDGQAPAEIAAKPSVKPV